MNAVVHHGDCLEVMRLLAPCSVDAVVTDPPYGIRFMGAAWDGADIEAEVSGRRAHNSHDPSGGPNGGHKSVAAEAGKYDTSPTANQAFQEWTRLWAIEAMRVLKPGGWLLSFASTRTYHRMTCGLEDAGFEIRDQIGWAFGSGFPKSHNGDWGGTALKPAWEPIAMARKPLIGTVEANWREHGTGALNIDACRVGCEERTYAPKGTSVSAAMIRVPEHRAGQAGEEVTVRGRWPANLIHDGSDHVLACFPDAPGQQGEIKYDAEERKTGNVYGAMKRGHEPSANTENDGVVGFKMRPGARRLDTGSAARFFYCAKASRADRNEGIGGSSTPAVSAGATMGDRERAEWDARNGNHHPTVKPTDLMRYLVRLVTPAGGVVLDPFTGSGSTGKAAVLEGLQFIGSEREADYVAIARTRIKHAQALYGAQTRDLFGEAA